MDTATCIVALAHEGKIWIGGDSAATDYIQDEMSSVAFSKVFMRIDQGIQWMFGFTGSYRLGQLLMYELELPKFEEADQSTPLRFLVKEFIPALQKVLREAGFEQKEKERVSGGTLMVCIAGKIFVITANYAVLESMLLYDAIGCAKHIALGSLFSTPSLKPEKRIQIALEAAEQFTPAVRRPFKILYT